jgi:hypothetical protein
MRSLRAARTVVLVATVVLSQLVPLGDSAAQEAPPQRGALLEAGAGGAFELLWRNTSSKTIHKSGGGFVWLRAGRFLSPRLALAFGLDAVFFQDEASCGDCIVRAPGSTVSGSAVLRFSPLEVPLWLEVGLGVTAQVPRISVGGHLLVAAGIDVLHRGRHHLDIRLEVLPLHTPLQVAGFTAFDLIVHFVLGLGYRWE